jgi:hypothetical protein
VSAVNDPRTFAVRAEQSAVLHTLLRPRPGSLLTSAVVGALAWLQADAAGADRAAVALAVVLFVYVVFNATAALVERIGSAMGR